MDFFLGTHRPNWLELVDVPLMVTVRTLTGRKSFPRARTHWWQDSNGFTQLSMPPHHYTSTPREYATLTRLHAQEIGNLKYVSPQDWMCEPVVRAKTGLSVAEHQLRTIDNYLELKQLAPELPWVPVLQGWEHDDYLRHVEQYVARGVDLMVEPMVGLGTVCRRQATRMAERLVKTLSALGLNIHGFGFKTGGLTRCATWLKSGDSLAWSFRARRIGRAVCGSVTHKNCANCLWFALRWRDHLLKRLSWLPEKLGWRQMEMFV